MKIIKNGFSYRYSFEPLGPEFAHSNQDEYIPLMNYMDKGKIVPNRDDYTGIALIEQLKSLDIKSRHYQTLR